MQSDQQTSQEGAELNQNRVNSEKQAQRRLEVEQQRLRALQQRGTSDSDLSSENILAHSMSQLGDNEVQIKIEQAKCLWTMKRVPHTKKTWFINSASELEIYDLLIKIINKLLSFQVQSIKLTHLEHLSSLFTYYLGQNQTSKKIEILKRILKNLEYYTKAYKLIVRNDLTINQEQYSINSHKFLNVLLQGLLFFNIDEFTSIELSSMFDLYVNQPKEYHSDYYELKIIIYLKNQYTLFLDLPWEIVKVDLSQGTIQLVNSIYKSNFITEYASLYEKIQPNQSISKNIRVYIQRAFHQLCNSPQYYCQLQQDVFCCIDLNGNVLFSKIDKSNSIIQLLMQIHSLVLSQLQHGIIIQKVKLNSFTFYSEIFELLLDNSVLIKNRIQYLELPDNWFKPEKQFIQEYSDLDLSTSINKWPSLHQILHYNPLLSIMISRIKELFVIIEAGTLNKEQKRIISQLQLNEQPTAILTKSYTKLEYFYVLLQLIEQALLDRTLFNKIQNILKIYPLTLKGNFDYFLCCKNKAKQMMLESYYMWLFQENRSSKYIAKHIECVIHQKIELCQIQQEDIRLIKKIVWSQNAWFAIQEINSIYEKTNEQIQSQEYHDLIRFLSTQQVLQVDIPKVFGITLLNGRICLHKKYNPLILSPTIRAMRIITLIHETFGHKKRIDYVDQQNVLTSTPDKLNTECGEYLETQIFGKPIQRVSPEQAVFLLDEENWSRPSDSFLKEFEKLPRPPDNVEQGDGNKENSPLKRQYTSNAEEENLEGGCLFSLLRRNS